MKQLIILFTLIGSVSIAFSQQYYVWSDPVAISDSSTNNTDATVKRIDFYGGHDYYTFWVRSEDTSSSDIYVQRYYIVEDPIPLVYEGDFHYRNPQVIPLENWNSGDTSFVLLYEADIDGDFDIYYQKYATNGFTEPLALTQTDTDEGQMQASNSGGVVWENDGNILFSRLKKTFTGTLYFDTTAVIDSIMCSNPDISKDDNSSSPQYISWEKIINDSSKICLREWANPGWLETIIVSDSGLNTLPRFSESTWNGVTPTLSWNCMLPDSAILVGYSPSYWSPDYYTPYFGQEIPFNPHFFNIMIFVDEVYDYSVMTFEHQEGSQTDIYGNKGYIVYNLSGHVNISNSSTIERNPYLFEGMFYATSYMDVINIWESWRNGHWQLFTSYIKVEIWGGVEDGRQQNLIFAFHPTRFLITLNYPSRCLRLQIPASPFEMDTDN